MGLQNPLNYIFDNPENPLNQAKDAVGEAAQSALDSQFGKGVINATQKPLSYLSKLAVPYRDYVAPALSAALLTANSNYRNQNQNLSTVEQLKHGFELSKQGVEGEAEWRRSISPGRALVGLIGDFTPGEQGTDKINWEDSKQVNTFFKSGSAQFWSGAADLGFNIVDPVAWALGKTVTSTRRSLVTRPVVQSTGRPGARAGVTTEKLWLDLDQSAKTPGANTPIEPFFKMVEANPDAITDIANYGFVASSADPTRLATAISTSYKINGRIGIRDIVGASIGHRDSVNKIVAEGNELKQHWQALKETTDVTEEAIKSLKKDKVSADKIDPKDLAARTAAEQEYQKTLKETEKIKRETEKALIPSQFINEFETPVRGMTWSKFSTLEQVRIASAQAKTKGLIVEVDPSKTFKLHEEVIQNPLVKNIPKPAIRYLMWLSPDAQLREHPSRIAFLGGSAGSRSHLEYDARLRDIAKITKKVDTKTQIELRNNYRTLSDKSSRNMAMEALQEKSLVWLLEKHYGDELSKMTESQLESANAFIQELLSSTKRAQAVKLQDIVSKNYTVVDGVSGDYVVHTYLNELVEQQALDIALSQNRSEVQAADRAAVMRTMQNVPLTETQVPNFHISYNFKLWDDVMSENPELLKKVFDGITKQNMSPAKVRQMVQEVSTSALDGHQGMGQFYNTTLKPNARLVKDVITESLDSFYTYVWKPSTLFSLKYTSRNVGEGWLRMIACAIDYNANLGHRWSDMFKAGALPDKGVVNRIVNNRIYRKDVKRFNKEFDKKNRLAMEQQGVLDQEFAPLGPKTKSALRNVKKDMDDALARERLHQEDGFVSCVEWMRMDFARIEKYKPTGNAAADKAAKYFNETVFAKIFSPATPDTDAGYFVTALASGDYKTAQAIAERAGSIELAQELSKYTASLQPVLENILKLKTSGSSSIDNVLMSARVGLERLIHHSDLMSSALVNRASLRDEIIVAAREKVAKRKAELSYTRKDAVEIHPGVFIDQSLAGRDGDMLRKATSSRASTTGFVMDDARVTAHSLLTGGYARDIIRISDARWANAHADYVNNVLMRDSVANRIVTDIANGETPTAALENVKKWLRSGDEDAMRWLREVNKNKIDRGKSMNSEFYNIDNLVDEQFYQVQYYLPLTDLNGKPYESLYNRAVEGLNVEDSLKLDYASRKDVMGNIEQKNSRLNNMYKNWVSSLFDIVGTLPENHLVRHPFFNMVYESEAKAIARDIAKDAKGRGLSDEQLANILIERKDAIASTAKNRAYKELMTKLYSIERYTDPGKLFRFVTPFYMAHQNSSRFWLGTTLRNPQTAVMLAKAYNSPFRAGYVYDEEGNVVSSGNPYDSASTTNKLVFNYPKFLAAYVGKEKFEANVNAIDIITQGQVPVIPTVSGGVFSPVVAAAIQRSATWDNLPQFIEKYTPYKYDEFIQHFIMPFYERQEATSVTGKITSNFVPLNSWMRSAVAAISGGKSGIPSVDNRWQTTYQEALKQIQIERNMNGQPLDPQEIQIEAGKLTRRTLVFEAASSFTGPVVAFKPVSENMSKLRAEFTASVNSSENYNEGSVKFVKSLTSRGVTNAAAIQSILTSSSVDNRYGLISNRKTISGFKSNIKSIETVDNYYPDNPFIGELFNQPSKEADDNSAIISDSMFSIKVNGKPLKSRTEDIEYQRQLRAGWAQYFNYIDYINAIAKKNNIEVGSSEYQQAFGSTKDLAIQKVSEQFPVWATRENQITLHKSDTFIAIATHFVNDKQFMNTVGKNNDAIIGLKKYLAVRALIVNDYQMNRGPGQMTLDAKANQKFAAMRDYVAKAITAKHKNFGQMYERYLSQDELNPVSLTLFQAGN